MRFQRVEHVAGLSSPLYFNYDCPQLSVPKIARVGVVGQVSNLYADFSMQGSIGAMGSVGDFWIKGGSSLLHSLSSFYNGSSRY